MLEVNVFLDEGDLHEGKPMHEYLMRYLMHHGIRGATVFAALMGYGHRHHLHHPRTIGGADEGPIMILFIDDAEKIRAVLPRVREVVKEGMITVKNVERA